jgi:hypothetical protein
MIAVFPNWRILGVGRRLLAKSTVSIRLTFPLLEIHHG